MQILVTGSTGFLGSGVLSQLVDVPRYTKIYVLIRSSKGQSAEERLIDLIKETFPPHRQLGIAKKLKAVNGDLTSPGLGLSAEDRALLVRNVEQILHIGASTKFALPIEELRQHNV